MNPRRAKNLQSFNSFFSAPILLRKDFFDSIQSLLKKGPEAFFFDDEDSFIDLKEERKFGVAVLNIEGVITHKGNFLSCLFGGCPLEILKDKLDFLVNDSTVKKIILNIDSPGGSVFGVAEFAEYVYSLRDKKEIVAIANTSACSAAYWIGSAASKFYASDKISVVGSIGVYATHTDIAQMLANEGLKITEVSSTPEKVLLSENKPLEQQGKDFLQSQVDYIYNNFIESVSRYRSVSAEHAKNKMGTGLVYFGQEAINLGFIDGISSIDELISSSVGKDFFFMETTGILAECPNLETLKMKHPAFYSSIIEPAINARFAAGKIEGIAIGTRRERNRIKTIEDTTISGYEKISYKMKFDGVSKPEQFALLQSKEIKRKPQSASNPLSSGIPVGFKSIVNEEDDRRKRRLENMKSGKEAKQKSGVK